MGYSKEFIREKLFSILFYDKKGNSKINSSSKINLEEIQERYDALKNDYKNEDFWFNYIYDLIDSSYEEELNLIELKKRYKKDFNYFIDSLLETRFSEEFRSEVKENINDYEKFIDKINKLKEENRIILDGERYYRAFISSGINESGYFEPFVHKTIKKYPFILIEIEKTTNSIHISGQKKEITNFKGYINSGEKLMKPIQISNFPEQNFINENLINELKRKNIFIKSIKIKNSSYFIVVGSNNIIDIDSYINSEFLFNSPIDFLAIDEIRFKYFRMIGNIEKSFEFILRFRKGKQDNTQYFKVEYFLSSRHKEDIKLMIDEEIKKHIDSVNIDIDTYYYYPKEYIFQEYINTSFNHYLENILAINKNDLVIKYLKDKEVIDENNDVVDDKFIGVQRNLLGKLKNQRVTISNNYFELINIEKKGKQIIIIFRETSTNHLDKSVRDYKVVIPNSGRLSKYEKIQKIIFTDLDYYLLFNSILNKKYDVALEYFYQRIEKFVLYHQNITLEKEVNFSFNFLNYYLDKYTTLKQNEDNTKLGDDVEININVLLKYLFKNFIPIGGSKQPDGYIILEAYEQETFRPVSYVLDSKQRTFIDADQYKHMKSYIENYAKTENNIAIKIKGGFFIICHKNLSTDSLNLSAKKDVLDNNHYEYGFISLEFLIKYFTLYRKHQLKIENNIQLKKSFYLKFYEIIQASNEIDNKTALEKLENKGIDELNKKIKEFSFYKPNDGGEI